MLRSRELRIPHRIVAGLAPPPTGAGSRRSGVCRYLALVDGDDVAYRSQRDQSKDGLFIRQIDVPEPKPLCHCTP